MRTKKTPPALPARLEGARRRFEHWRRTRKRRSPIPEPLWAAAVELAGNYGPTRTARTLRLNYEALKKRHEAAAANRQEGSAPAFFEVVPPGRASSPECVVELEDPRGAKMRIHLKGAGAPDLAALTRTFWSEA